MFNQYGQLEGESQIAPGRDLAPLQAQRRNGRPPQANVNTAITGGMPVGNTPFRGAQQTIGAQPSQAPTPGMSNPMATVNVPGMQAPAPASQPPMGGDIQSTVMGILSKHGYGPQALLAAEAELAAQGVQLQKDSQGRARGRIKLPNGDIVDIFDPREGRTEQNNWLNNPQGQNWAWDFKGQEGLDAGGWSFNGPGGGGFNPGIASAITGTNPLGGQTGEDFSTRVRQQVMQALQNQPGLAELGKMFGV